MLLLLSRCLGLLLLLDHHGAAADRANELAVDGPAIDLGAVVLADGLVRVGLTTESDSGSAHTHSILAVVHHGRLDGAHLTEDLLSTQEAIETKRERRVRSESMTKRERLVWLVLYELSHSAKWM